MGYDPNGISALEAGAGVSQLRIKPQNFTAQDGEYVFCLGSDLVPPPIEAFLPEMSIILGNYEVDVSDGTKFVKFGGRLRQPYGLPVVRLIEDATLICTERVEGEPDYNLTTIQTATPQFTSADVDRLVWPVGDDVSSYWANIDQVVSPTVVRLSHNLTGGVPGSFPLDYLRMCGFYWQFEITVGDLTVMQLDMGRDGLGLEVDLPDRLIPVYNVDPETPAVMTFRFTLREVELEP